MQSIINKGKYRKVFKSWLISYIIILVIPILTGVIVYAQSLQTIKDEVSNVRLSSITRLKSILDGRFEGFERICGQLSMNQNIKNMMASTDSIDPHTIMDAFEAQKDLTGYSISNPLLDNIYIYLNNADFIISAMKKYNSNDIDSMLLNETGLTGNEFQVYKKSNNFMNCAIKQLDTGQKKLIIMHSLFNSSYKSPKATIIFVIDQKKILNLLNSSGDATEGTALIIDAASQYIGNLESGLPQYATFEQLSLLDNIFSERIDNENNIIVHSKSDELQLEYMMIFSTHVFMSKFIYIRNIIYIYIIFCLLLGSLMAYYFTTNNYNPLNKLVKKVTNQGGGASTASKVNEFIIVESSIDELFKENDIYKQDIQRQKLKVRNNMLARFVKGQLGSSILVKDMLEEQDINFNYNSFLIMLIAFEKTNENNSEDYINSDDTKAIASAVRNIVDSEINTNFACYNIEVDEWLALLFNVDVKNNEDGDILLDSLTTFSQRGLKDIRSRASVGLFIAVSDIHAGYQGAHDAFSEATEIIEYKNFLNMPDSIIQYQSINQINKESIVDGHYNMEIERQFINSILAKDYKNALNIFNDIITSEFDKLENLQLAKCRTFGIINSLLNALVEIRTTIDVDFFEQLDPINKLLKTQSVQELKSEVKHIFYQISEYIDNDNSRRIPDWVKEVERYVKLNYNNPSLSIEAISKNFNLNMSYLSRTYKQFRGIGLLEYLHSIRLENAKVLIVSGMKIHEIACSVGYLDSQALIRAFKRYEGVTPGQFMKITEQI